MDAFELYKETITSFREHGIKVFSDKVLRGNGNVSDRSLKECRRKLMTLNYMCPCGVGKDWNSLINTRLIPKNYSTKDLNKEYRNSKATNHEND